MSVCSECGAKLPRVGAPCPTCSDDSTVTRANFPTLPGFRVLREIGEGGMGQVFAAEASQLRRSVAIKFLAERLCADEDARKRFLREARSMASVEHPNVVRIYSFGESEGRAYIEMEMVDGESLSDRLRRQGRLSVGETLEIALGVTDALDAAWSKGIIHRDIKPANVLLDQKGRVLVADFGLAKTAPSEAAADASGLTGSGVMIGTPFYVSPEQAQGEPVDHRSDIYSFGIMLFEMISGRRPFRGKTPVSVIAKQVLEPLPSLDVEDVPPKLAKLVQRMTAKKPSDRPDSFEDLRSALQELVQTKPTAHVVGHKPGARIFVFAGLALLALATALYVGLRRPVGPTGVDQQPVRVEKLTSKGNVRNPVLSPDGRYLTYLTADEKTSLWVRDVDDQSEVRLVDEIIGEIPLIHFFGHDGASVYFSVTDSAPSTRLFRRLFRIPLIGGQPRAVVEGLGFRLSPTREQVSYQRRDDGVPMVVDLESEGQAVLAFDDFTDVSRALWSPDGRRMLVSSSVGDLAVIDVGRESIERIHHDLDSPIRLIRASWRPGSDTVAFAYPAARGQEIRMLDLRGGESVALGLSFERIESLAWLPSGAKVVVNASANSSDASLIWLVDYPSGERRSIVFDGAEYSRVRLSDDGTALVAEQSTRQSEILVADSGSRQFKRQIVGTGVEYSVAWTPDGRVVYSSNEAGTYDLYTSVLGDNEVTRLTFDEDSDEIDPAVASSGTAIVFSKRQPDGASVWRMDHDGSSPVQLTPVVPANRWLRPQVSPDGQRVLYMDWTKAGPGLSVVPINGGTPTPLVGWRQGEPLLPRKHAFGAGWSPNGERLAFFYFTVSADEEFAPITLTLGSAEGTIEESFHYTDGNVPYLGNHQRVHWSRDGSELYFQRDGKLWKRPAGEGAETQLTFFDEPVGDFDVSPVDGRIAATRTTELSDAVLVTGFR